MLMSRAAWRALLWEPPGGLGHCLLSAGSHAAGHDAPHASFPLLLPALVVTVQLKAPSC